MSFSSDIPLQSNQLPISFEMPEPQDPSFKQILSLFFKRYADSINTKEGALYLLQELATFKQFYTTNNPQLNRFVYRTTFDLVNLNGGPIAPGVMAPVPHGITGLFETALIYASCTNTQPIYFTLVYPYVYLDAVNINFTNPTAAPITNCSLIAEYLKN